MTLKLNKPLVTVLMSVYNAEEHVCEAIDSILNQSYVNFEFVIIDDGSTDNSLQILESYKDQRIKIIKNIKNQGLSMSLNLGIKIAKGRYIARMDADDISLPDRLAKQIEFLREHEDVYVLGGQVEVIESTQKWKYPLDDAKIRCSIPFLCPFAHPTIVFRKELFSEFNFGYDESFRRCQDYRLWTDFLGNNNLKLKNLDEVVLKYRTKVENVNILASPAYLETLQKLREIILKKIIDKPIKNDDVLYSAIFRGSLEINEETVLTVESFFKKILVNNHRVDIFKSDYLRYYLWKKYLYLAYYSKINLANKFFIFLNSFKIFFV